MSHLHLPVQHGSDRILMAMKRGYTAMEYKSTVRKLRAVRPGHRAVAATSSSASPARPRTTSRKMMKLIDDVGFDASFSFIFSPRPGTPAAALHDDTPHDVKLQRLQQLQAVIEATSRRISAAASARCSASWSKARRARTPTELMGRTECNRIVNFAGAAAAGRPDGRRDASPRPFRIRCAARCCSARPRRCRPEPVPARGRQRRSGPKPTTTA